MIREKLRYWFGITPTTLALQLVEQEARYVVRHGVHILTQGICTAPNAIVDGHLSDPAELARVLLPKLPKTKGQVAALLPARWLHLHEMNVPNGLDAEELVYQIDRYITHTLGLSLNDVFYDWSIQGSADKRTTSIQLAIARQTDVAPFHQVFMDSDWDMQWVCAQAQVWSLAYHKQFSRYPVAICQVEAREISVWMVEPDGRVRSFYKRFDDGQLTNAGFTYHAAGQKEGALQLPTRFVLDELAVLLPVWLGERLQALTVIYCTGKGVNWVGDMALIQSRIGLPIRLAEEGLKADAKNGAVVKIDAGLAVLWHLSKQVHA